MISVPDWFYLLLTGVSVAYIITLSRKESR